MSREANIRFLVEMGFSRELATEAISVNGYVEPAIAWCTKKQQSAVGYTLGGQTPGGGGQTLGGGGGQTLGGGGQTLGGGGQTLGGGGQTLGGGGQTLGEGGDQTLDGQTLGDYELTEEQPETTEPKRQLTPEEREAALQKIKERIAEKKKQSEVDNQISELEREKLRRKEGKEAQAAKEAWEKAEAEREASIKRKEKERDQMAKEKIREQIRIDQLNREAEQKKLRGEATPTQQVPTVKKEYDTCTIQVRMPDNSRLQNDFNPSDNIHTVLDFVNANRKDGKRPITLSTTFPRKSYTGSALNTTLKDAEMAPRGMFVASYT